MRVEKTLMQTLASQLSLLLFSFDRGIGAWELRKNSHANSRYSCSHLTGAWELRKLSCKLSLLNSHYSCSHLTGAWELRNLSCKLSLLNSHQLSCNSCSRWPGHESWENVHAKLSLLNSHQLSCNSCSCLTGTWELRKLSCKLSLLNSHATLVLVDQDMRVEKTFMQTLASQLSSTLMQLLFSLTGAWELRKLSCKLSLLNSHATLVLVDRGMRVEKTLIQTLASQLSSTLMQLLFSLTGAWELRKLSCKLSLLKSHQLSCNSCSRWPGHESWQNSHANSRFSTLILWLGHFHFLTCLNNSGIS
jgi:hypothetical protein